MRWMALILAASLAACGGAEQEGPPLPSGEQEDVPPGPTTNPNAAVEGMYTLAEVGAVGAPPAIISTEGECQVEVVQGSLRMEAGRFAFMNETREVCGGTQRGDVVMHSAGGTYEIQGATIRLTSDVGDAFATASGTMDEHNVVLQEMSTTEGAETVNWRFYRRDVQLQPEGGTTGDGMAPPGGDLRGG